MGDSDISDLIEALRCLPGVGPRSAQRMAYHVLQRDRTGGLALAKTLNKSLSSVRHCQGCNTLTQKSLCNLCSSPERDHAKLCIVEMPVDVAVLEQTGVFKGLYFVLMGRLSPLDGIGPSDISLDLLPQKIDDLKTQEVILATSFTSEGDATAHFITQQLSGRKIKIRRISKGLPLGGELEYSESGQIAQAFKDRIEIT